MSFVHYQLLKEHAPLLRGCSLLEIGQANWYGDADPRILLDDVDAQNTELIAEILEVIQSRDLFRIARLACHVLFEPSVVESVDIHGRSAFKQDLNGPLSLPRKYTAIINHGTSEHIFNIGYVFKSIHDWCGRGGIMIHESPFTGWIDHGFYCLQPTLFYDLATANEYDLLSLTITHIGTRQMIRVESRDDLLTLSEQIQNNSMLFVVMRKTVSAPFRVPMQGIYGGRLSERGRKAWHVNR